MNIFKKLFLSLILVVASLSVAFGAGGTNIVVFNELMLNLSPEHYYNDTVKDTWKSIKEYPVFTIGNNNPTKKEEHTFFIKKTSTGPATILRLEKFIGSPKANQDATKAWDNSLVQDLMEVFYKELKDGFDYSIGSIQSRKVNVNGLWCIEILYEYFDVKQQGYRGFGHALLIFGNNQMYRIIATSELTNNRGYGDILQKEQAQIIHSVRASKVFK